MEDWEIDVWAGIGEEIFKVKLWSVIWAKEASFRSLVLALIWGTEAEWLA